MILTAKDNSIPEVEQVKPQILSVTSLKAKYETAGECDNQPAERKEELGGYKGKEPTHYGDWQHKGRVTDF